DRLPRPARAPGRTVLAASEAFAGSHSCRAGILRRLPWVKLAGCWNPAPRLRGCLRGGNKLKLELQQVAIPAQLGTSCQKMPICTLFFSPRRGLSVDCREGAPFL